MENILNRIFGKKEIIVPFGNHLDVPFFGNHLDEVCDMIDNPDIDLNLFNTRILEIQEAIRTERIKEDRKKKLNKLNENT